MANLAKSLEGVLPGPNVLNVRLPGAGVSIPFPWYLGLSRLHVRRRVPLITWHAHFPLELILLARLSDVVDTGLEVWQRDMTLLCQPISRIIHYNNVMWASNHRQLDSLFKSLPNQTSKKQSKLHNTGPLWGESKMTRKALSCDHGIASVNYSGNHKKRL